MQPPARKAKGSGIDWIRQVLLIAMSHKFSLSDHLIPTLKSPEHLKSDLQSIIQTPGLSSWHL